MAFVQHRPLASLPSTSLSWLQLKDHFVATVGPSAGQGRPLGPLLVLADATFAPRSRFPLHPHRDMEILSVVLEGEMSHHGDGANGSVVKPRGMQLISSRDGMMHAEGNDTEKPVRMLQVWFQPSSRGGKPEYFYRQLPETQGTYVVAGDEGMPLRAEVKVSWIDVRGAQVVKLAPGRTAYCVGIAGPVKVEGVTVATGEGATVRGEECALEGQGAVLWIEVAA